MKLRIIGTIEECKQAEAYYASLRGQENINWVEISAPYANRGNSQLYRLYVEVSYKTTAQAFSHGERSSSCKDLPSVDKEKR